MKQLIAIGEALIDFIPQQAGVGLQDVDGFFCRIGGAPANVCAAFTKLGGKAALLSQVGADAFGDKIVAELGKAGLNTEYIQQTEKAKTSLAFVSLKADGNRDFAFYRNPGADMLFQKEQILRDYFEDAFALHFCSVSLGDYPMKEAHKQAIEYALSYNNIVSFDLNIRLPLWPDKELLRKRIWEFLPCAHIVKLSEEELSFMTDYDQEEAIEGLFQGNVKMVLLTKGADGAEVYTPSIHVKAEARETKAIDTTGAGDAFVGSFLYQLHRNGYGVSELDALSENVLQKMLNNSCRYCEASIREKGAIDSYPSADRLHMIGWQE